MIQFLDFFRLEEAIELVILGLLLAFLGREVMHPSAETVLDARRAAAAMILFYCGAGICVLYPSGATELLIIVIRGLLAGGITYGAALFLAPLARLGIAKCRRQHVAPAHTPVAPTVRAQLTAEERAKAEAKVRQMNQEREAKVKDAREEVERFYALHEGLIGETLPPALFRSQLQLRFPVSAEPAQAWAAAEEMIAGMLPLVAQGRERERTAADQARKRDEQLAEEERKKREREEQGSALRRLAEWHEKEKDTIKQTVPAGHEQDLLLHQLFDRYEHLLRETLAEMKP